MKTGFGGKLSRSNGIETNNKEQWNELFRTARAVKFNSLKKLNACNCKEREIENKRRKTNDRKKEKRRKKQQQQRYTISDSTSLSWFDLFSFFLLRWCCCFVSLFHFVMCVVCVCLNAKQNKYRVRKKNTFFFSEHQLEYTSDSEAATAAESNPSNNRIMYFNFHC